MMALVQVVAAFTAAFCCSLAHGSRILFLCDEIKSRQLVFATIADELIVRGHEVYWPLLSSSIMADKFHGPGKHPLIYGSEGAIPDPEKTFQEMTEASLDKTTHGEKTLDSVRQKMKKLFDAIAVELLMNSEEMMQILEEQNMDIAIVDAFFESRFKYLVAHRLGIPYVSSFVVVGPWEARIPWVPSFVPMTIGSFSPDMTFFERVKNTFMFTLFHFNGLGSEPPSHILEKYTGYGHFGSTKDLVRQSALWFFPSEDVLMDYSKPMMANMISAGGLTVKPAEPLSSEWEEILQSSQHGVVLASFGTVASSFPDVVSEKLLRAFSQLNQTVIFRFKNTNQLKVPLNVYLSDWIPQMDLLASGHVKVFVTHCGINSQYEALATGVPMVGMPLFGDQFYNARRAVYKGYTLQVSAGSFEPEDLVNAINTVANDTGYRQRIGQASKIFNARRERPVERVASGVEFILDNGPDVLRSHLVDMPLYKILMLDVLGALVMLIYAATLGLAALAYYLRALKSVKQKSD